MRSAAQLSPVGRLLREWRTRRAQSQLDLAGAAEVSARHLSFVETGRAQPSRELLRRLAGALGLSLADRNALLLAGGFRPMHPARGIASAELTRVRAVLQRLLSSHEPFPAVLLDRGFNVVMANSGMQRLFGLLEFTPPLDGPLNLLTALLVPAIRSRFEDWPAVARTALKRAHREDAARGGDKELQALLAEVSRIPGLPTDWAWNETAEADLPCLTFTVTCPAGRFTWMSTITSFGTPQDVTVQGLQIESYFPADEETERRWQQAG